MASAGPVQFGAFRFDPASRELRKDGTRLKVPDQSLVILGMLLERPGEVVDREAIQARLWPHGTVVEFDHSVNSAVKRLREALLDSADKPRYVETLPRRGYRFVGPVARERPKLVELEAPREETSSRPQDSAAAGIEIEEAAVQPASAVAPSRRISRRWLPALVALGVVAGVLIGVGVMWRLRPALAVIRSVIKLEPGYGLDGMRYYPAFMRPSRTAMVLSADGRFLVYSAVAENAVWDARGHLYLRRLDQPAAKLIPGTEGGISPFLAPDDRWVGFWAGGKFMKVPIDGGVPVTLCDAVGRPYGATWGSDNRIVFSSAENVGLSVVPADGGKPEVLTVPDKTRQEYGHRLPHFLPGGKGLLFTVMRDPYDLQPRVAVLQMKTRQWRTLLDDAADARCVPTGHIVFLRQGTLMAARFDLDRLAITGQPVPLIDDVMQALNIRISDFVTAAGQFSTSGSGALVYAAGGITPDREDSLVWVDQRGTAQLALPFKGPF